MCFSLSLNIISFGRCIYLFICHPSSTLVQKMRYFFNNENPPEHRNSGGFNKMLVLTMVFKDKAAVVRIDNDCVAGFKDALQQLFRQYVLNL